MPRKPRAYAEGFFHFAAHGSDVRHLFSSDEEREDFLEQLAVVCERYELAVLSYALMGTHYHTILRIPDARIAQALQRLHSDYSRRCNRRSGRSAHLFRAHPMARMIESDADLVGTARYVARNPVEAGLVRDPLAWPWSSARAHAGLEPPRIPLAEEPLEAAFGGARWRRNFVEQIRRC
jgi:putative transposase